MQSDSGVNFQAIHIMEPMSQNTCSLNVHILSWYVCTIPIFTDGAKFYSVYRKYCSSDFTNSISIALHLIHVMLRYEVYFTSKWSAKWQAWCLFPGDCISCAFFYSVLRCPIWGHMSTRIFGRETVPDWQYST